MGNFRSDDQQRIMCTVANENENVYGSTNDPNLEFTGSIENKVSTVQKGKGTTHHSINLKKAKTINTDELYILQTDFRNIHCIENTIICLSYAIENPNSE